MIAIERCASADYAIFPAVNHMLGSTFQLAGKMTATTAGGYYVTQPYRRSLLESQDPLVE